MSSEVKQDVLTAIRKGVVDAAASPQTQTTGADVSIVTSKVFNQIGPLIAHLTDSEPWYQSRVTWGVIIAAVSTIAKPFIGELPIDAAQTADVVNALATAGQGIGFALTLYGRWKAKKPLGSNNVQGETL